MSNIAIVTPLFPTEERPQYCVYLYQQAQALRALGHQVTVIKPDSGLANGEIVTDEFRGITVVHIGYRSNRIISLLNSVPGRFAGAMRSHIQESGYQLVSLNMLGICIEKIMIKICSECGVKSVIHYHGLDISLTHYIPHKKIISFLNYHRTKANLKRVDGVIGVSDKVCDEVRKILPVSHLYMVYNGADEQVFFPKQEKRGENEPFRILCVANLNPIKGHRYLFEAVHKLCEEQPYRKIHIKLIGIGSCESELRKMADGLSVEFMGEQDYPVVAREMQEADFYIMPSYYEAIGCVYLEAMLTKTAVLGVRGCGIDEVIEDRINGYLVSPQNSQEIADCIKFSIDNPEKHKEIAQKGYETVRDKFTWKDSAKALDKAFRKILEQNKEKKI